MNIIYITTALDNEDYKVFCKLWSVSLNPSNQNFHNKLIRSLAINNNVEVISLRPFSRTYVKTKELKKEDKVVNNVHWNYLEVKRNILERLLNFKKQAFSIVKNLPKEEIIITDTINPSAITIASSIAKKFNYPIIGICTDSPSNITGTTRKYSLYLQKKAKSLSGYMALTTELEEMYNDQNKPSLIFEGIVDDFKSNSKINIDGEYIFFGGALLERYGIYNLIDAFKELNRNDIKLVICGHHANKEELEKRISNNKNIIYLGTLNVEDVIKLEEGSLICINPRPYSEDLDRYSIPSKTLEYFYCGAFTISVKNTKLQKDFYNDCLWAKSGSKEDLYNAILKALEMDKKERKAMANNAKTKVKEKYSLEAINKLINDYISLLK